MATTKTPEQKARAYELLDFLEENPYKHDQNFWVVASPDKAINRAHPMTTFRALSECGTTACAAGWAVMLAGGVVADRSLEGLVTMPDGRRGSIPVVAANLLGLTKQEARDLFVLTETLERVREEIERIYGLDERPR